MNAWVRDIGLDPAEYGNGLIDNKTLSHSRLRAAHLAARPDVLESFKVSTNHRHLRQPIPQNAAVHQPPRTRQLFPHNAHEPRGQQPLDYRVFPDATGRNLEIGGWRKSGMTRSHDKICGLRHRRGGAPVGHE